MSAAALDILRFGLFAGVTHLISGREGGVSEDRCATLNTSYSVGDERERVDENIRRVAAAVGAVPEQVHSAYQVHGNAVMQVTPASPPRPQCDVLITDDPRCVLMLRYADCTPVLIDDQRLSAVAAVHAGWRGTAVRAAGAAVHAMVEAFGSNPRDLRAGIGPAIGPCCYAVGADVEAVFADRPWAIVRPAGQQMRLDLWEANRRALVEAGVPADQIELAGICTQCQSERFFSHRANAGQPAGRFAALIRPGR